METQAPKPCADGSATSAADENQEPKNDNASLDAWSRSLATIDPAILNHVIEIASGLHCKDENFKTNTGTVRQLFERLMLIRDASGTQRVGWARGPKDGPCILQGGLFARQRSANNVRANHIVMVDYDTGYSIEEIAAAIRKHGLFALLWTTHSHLKSETLIAEAALLKWAAGREIDVALVGAYLTDVKKYKAEIAASISSLERDYFDGSIKFKVVHAPMPRVRALFVLAGPFEFAKHGTQAERIVEWKQSYAGFCQLLNLPWDRSCCDPSRLMYTPRIAKNADERQHAYMIVAGRMLCLDDVPRIDTKSGTQKKKKGGAPGSERAEICFQTPGLASFLRHHARDFEAADWMVSVDPDGIRRDQGNGKMDFCCPNEDSHTEIKGDDTAFMVINASARDGGFYMGCLHDGCIQASGQDRGWYLDQACVKYDVSDASELEEWCPAAQEEAAREKEQEQTLAELINSLTPTSTPDQIDAVVGRITDSNKTQAAKDALLRSAAEKVDGKWTARVESKWRRYFKDANARGEEDSPSQLTLANPNGIYLHFHYKDQLAKTKALFAERNATPYIFTREEGGQFRTFEHNGKVKSEEMTGSRSAWHDELNAVADFRRISDKNGDQGVAPFPDIITAFVGTTQLDLPVLDQIVYFAIFDQSGKLRTEQGYDPGTRCYLDPKFTPTLDGNPVPTNPTDDDVATALRWITEAVFDMPFTDCFGEADIEPQYNFDDNGERAPNPRRGAASFEHFIAIGLEMIMRNMIKGPCPAKHIAKPEVGTGGSLVVKVLHNIFTGEDPSDIPLSSLPEELRKLITSLLRCAGSNLLFFDNIASDHLNMPFMAQLLTAGVWQDRILSKSEIATIPFTKQIVFCGNRLTFTKEMIRRNVPVGLNTYLSNPASDRDSSIYRHYPLIDWVLEHKADLAGAFYTLAFRGIHRGVLTGGVKPVRTLASFDGWSQIIGGTLAACGLTAFLGNLESYRDDVSSEEEENAYSDIVQKVWERQGHKRFNRDVVEMADPLGAVFKKDSTGKSRETSSGKQINRNLIDKTFDVIGPPGKWVPQSDPDSGLRTSVVFACVREKRPKEFELKKIG